MKMLDLTGPDAEERLAHHELELERLSLESRAAAFNQIIEALVAAGMFKWNSGVGMSGSEIAVKFIEHLAGRECPLHDSARLAEFVKDERDIYQLCEECGGWGKRAYSSTATWRGGIGGQMFTTDVCDKCWGSGDAARPWPSWRAVIEGVK